jgi:hypothetical protein
MNSITSEQFDDLLKAAPIKPRFKRDVKFGASTERLDDGAWSETELLPIWNKSVQGGILLLQPQDTLYMVPFEAVRPASQMGGRVKPVICDFCYTWQASGRGGFITFYPDKSSLDTVSLLCCLDLRCSDHVRTKTPAAVQSRAQLREHISSEGRVERLQRKLQAFITRIDLQPIA